MSDPITRAYALLYVKALDEERRVITGIASTPEPDRHGDVIELSGVSYRNPLPLLLHHDSKRPVGTTTLTRASAAIEFEASLPIIAEAGALKDRVDEAWQSVKAGLIHGVSIGFRAFEDGIEFLKGGGIKFTHTEILELSLVTVPANASATIAAIKAYDRAALGASRNPSGASELPIVRAIESARPMHKTITEQISAFENTRAAKDARMRELMTSAAEKGITLDAEQTEEYDNLSAEVKAVDAHLVRLRDLEKTNVTHATPITATSTQQATAQRSAIVSVKANVPKGTAFTRYAMSLVYGRGDSMRAIEFAKQWRDSTPEVELVLKAAVAPGTTADATWAAPLAALTPLASEFLELLRPQTVLGKIPGLRMVPFNISIATQTGGGSYGWVGQGAPKPVTKLAFGSATLGISKCAGIVVITEELARVSTPSAEQLVRNDMIAGIAQFLDVEFTDPTKAPVANVSPGSITNGVTPITSAGVTPANARTDMQALLNAMVAAGIPVDGVVLLMSSTNALALGSALNPLGQPLYPNMGLSGGNALGITVIASQVLGANVIALQPNAILLADDGGVNIDVSREASVQMDSAPDNPPLATTILTSLWQENLIGLRAERFINWKRARTGAVQYTVQTYAA